MEFHVGDVVELTVDHPDGNEHLYAGDVGRVICCDGEVAVEFETLSDKPSGHNCGGRLRNANGWWVREDQIRLADTTDNEDDVITEITEDELSTILMMK